MDTPLAVVTKYLELRGLTAGGLAAKSGVPDATVRRFLESGRAKWGVVLALLDALGVDDTTRRQLIGAN